MLNLSAGEDRGQDTISEWTIDWGDGQVETVPGNPSSVTHVYADGRTFTRLRPRRNVEAVVAA